MYALLDIRTKEVRYVGISDDAYRRYREHVFTPSKALADWINECMSDGTWPELLQLELVDPKDKRDAEQHYMDVMRSRGHRLLNKVRSVRNERR